MREQIIAGNTCDSNLAVNTFLADSLQSAVINEPSKKKELAQNWNAIA